MKVHRLPTVNTTDRPSKRTNNNPPLFSSLPLVPAHSSPLFPSHSYL